MNPFEVLSRVIEITNAPVDVDRRLKNLVDILAHQFSLALCALVLWDPNQSRFFLKSISGKHPSFPPDMSISPEEGPLAACTAQKIPFVIPDSSQLSLFSPPLPPAFAQFRFLGFFPIFDDILLYGVLTLLGDQPRQLSEEEKETFLAIGRQLCGTLRSSHVSLQAKKRIAELSTLHAIGVAISSTLDLGELLRRISLSSAKILQADGSMVHFLDEDSGLMKLVSSYGIEEGDSPLTPLVLGEELVGTVALTGKPIVLRETQTSHFSFRGFPPGICSLVCVPLVHQRETVGILYVDDFTPRKFTKSALQGLEILAQYPIFSSCPGIRLTWRWSLSRIRNAFGQEILIGYHAESEYKHRNGCKVETTMAVYPSEIRYPHNRYRVSFVLAADRTDYDTAWTSVNSFTFYSRSRLSETRRA